MVFGKINDKAIVELLKKNPTIILKMSNKIGASKFRYIMKFLGINPFTSATNKGKFIGVLKKCTMKGCAISKRWAYEICTKAKKFGYSVQFHKPHGYGWHMHLFE